MEMNTKITDKNMKALSDSHGDLVDKDFGLSTPSMLLHKSDKPGVDAKTEFHLDILSATVKANKTTHLISVVHNMLYGIYRGVVFQSLFNSSSGVFRARSMMADPHV